LNFLIGGFAIVVLLRKPGSIRNGCSTNVELDGIVR